MAGALAAPRRWAQALLVALVAAASEATGDLSLLGVELKIAVAHAPGMVEMGLSTGDDLKPPTAPRRVREAPCSVCAGGAARRWRPQAARRRWCGRGGSLVDSGDQFHVAMRAGRGVRRPESVEG